MDKKMKIKNIIICVETVIIIALTIALIIVTCMFIKNKEENENSNSKSTGYISSSASNNKKDSNYTQAELNEKITIKDMAEVTFSKAYSANKILPPNPTGIYTYHGDKENETYIVLQGTYKNLLTNEFSSYKNFSGKLKVNDKYEYSNVFIDFATENGGDFHDPKSLQTMNCYVGVSIPDEVLNESNNKYTFYLDFKTDSNATPAKYRIDLKK